MYTRVSLSKPVYSTLYTWLVQHNNCVFPKYVTIYIKNHISNASIITATYLYPLNTWLLSLKPTYFSRRCQKKKFLEVWVVMPLTPLVVTYLYLTLSLHKNINRGGEVHERGLEPLHCYGGGIGSLIPPTLSLESFSLFCRASRLSSLEKRSSRTRSRFCEVPDLKRRYICTSFHD